MKEIYNKEEHLFIQILDGDISAMKNFYDAYSRYLMAVCSRYILSQDDVKDVLQESFIKIFKNIKTFNYKGEGSLKAWASRIVVNESLLFLNRNGRLSITDNPKNELPDVVDDVEEPDFEDISTETIQEIIRSLPIGYRTVFNLYIFEQKSHKEIATILNITENTSASQFHRAKRLLVKEITLYRSKTKAII